MSNDDHDPNDDGPPSAGEPVSWQGNLVEAIRQRPGMFVGDMRDGYGLHELLNTVLRWAVEKHVAGSCTKLDVMIDMAGGACVTMFGVRVEPSEIEPLLFGTKRDLNLVAVTALSTSVSLASVPESGARFEYTAVAGKAQGVAPFVDESPVRTKIHFTPDAAFFNWSSFDYTRIETRLREIAFLNDTLPIHLYDWRTFTGNGQWRRGMQGRIAFVDFLRGGARSLPVMHILAGDGPAAEAGVKPPIAVDFALCWRAEAQAEPMIRSFANQLETRDGGHHVTALRHAARLAVCERIPAAQDRAGADSRKVAKWVKRQMIAFVAITHPDPSFHSPTRSVLWAPDVVPIVHTEVHRVLGAYFDKHPEEIVTICEAVRAAPL